MAQQRILIVGNSLNSLKSYLTEHGFDYVTLKDRTLTQYPDKRLKNRVVCDFSSDTYILETVDELVSQYPIDGVMVIYEQYIRSTALIASHLGLPGISPEAAAACTDKDLMRSLFARAPFKISPDFAVASSEDIVRQFAASHHFPLIIKPANLSKSLLVTKSSSLEQLINNYRKTVAAVDNVYRKYAPHATPKLLIEEFMEGPVKSVDAFVDQDGKPHILDAIVDYQTGHDIGFADNFHYSRLLPADISSEEAGAIKRVAAAGVKTLGMKSTPAHIEIIYTKDGPMIVEIGARNGGYRERMHALANDVDITDNAIRLSLGQTPDLALKKNESVGVFELFPKNPGTFNGLSNEAQLRELPSLKYLSIKPEQGAFVGSSSDGYKMCAIVILHNADRKQFMYDMNFLNKHVSVQTTPLQTS